MQTEQTEQTNQSNQNISEVEQYWNRTRAKFNVTTPWNELDPVRQNAVIESVNLLLMVLHNTK